MIKTLCILDSAAGNSSIDASFARTLKTPLVGPKKKTLIYLDRKATIETYTCEIELVAQDRVTSFKVRMETAENFASNCHLHPWPNLLKRHKHLENLPTPSYPNPPCGTLLIGVDNAHLLEVLEYRKSSKANRPLGVRTALGWAFMGPDPWGENDTKGEAESPHPRTTYKTTRATQELTD